MQRYILLHTASGQPRAYQWLIKMHRSINSVNEHSRICTDHFSGSKRNGRGGMPRLFPWNSKKRKPPKEHCLPPPPASNTTLRRGKRLYQNTMVPLLPGCKCTYNNLEVVCKFFEVYMLAKHM